MKKILEIKEIKKNIIRVRLEATKRTTLYLKIENDLRYMSCSPQRCSLYRECCKLRSPLRKYKNFGEFCNNLFLEYPRLEKILGISITATTPLKRKDKKF